MNFSSSLISYLICGNVLFCSFEYLFDDKLCNNGTEIFMYPTEDTLSLQGMYVIPYFHPSNITISNVTDCSNVTMKFINIQPMYVEDTSYTFSFNEEYSLCTTELPSFDSRTLKHGVLVVHSGLESNKTYTVKRKQDEAGRKKYLVTGVFDDQINSVVMLELERNDVEEAVLCYPDMFPSTMFTIPYEQEIIQSTWEEDCVALTSKYEISDPLEGPEETIKFNATHNRQKFIIEAVEFNPVILYRYVDANNHKFFAQDEVIQRQANGGFYLSPLARVILMNFGPFSFVSFICALILICCTPKTQI